MAIQGFGPPPPAPSGPDVHVSQAFTSDDILSAPKFYYEVNAMGEESGLIWVSGGQRVGWRAESFQKIRNLAGDLVRSKPFNGVASEEFALEVICTWLVETLERERSDALSTWFETRCRSEVREHYIWIPLFRTYSSSVIRIGNVTFQTISKQMLDEWQARALRNLGEKAVSLEGIERRRTRWQGSLAACIHLKGERKKVEQLALTAAINATALLSFLSPANENSRLTNFGTILGLEKLGQTTTILVENGNIVGVHEKVSEEQYADWFLDHTPQYKRWVLPALDNLASALSTEFRRALFDALILHSRQAQALELSDKLVFALSALESLFLRDASEPIQKNLGERIAFLIGTSSEERKQIVGNVQEIYKIRSAFVHHGQVPRHQTSLDQFLRTTWTTFAELLRCRDQYKTKAALIGALEDRKMS